MIFLFLLLIASPLCADTLAENQARFGVITGDVGLLSLGAVDWIEPHEGLPIEPGDRIRTGEDGTVEVIMGENILPAYVMPSHTLHDLIKMMHRAFPVFMSGCRCPRFCA